MASHQESSHGPGTPSVDEAISWLMDSMLAAGIVGFSDDYIAPHEILQNWRAAPSCEEPLEAPGSALMLIQDLNDSHAEEALMQKRIEIVNADKVLRQQAKIEVHSRLLASGISDKGLEKTMGKTPTLTKMTKLLYERQAQKPKVIETVWCRVVTGLPGTIRFSTIRLPKKASLWDVYGLLRKFVSTRLLCASSKGMPREELDNIMSAWRYQIVTENDKGKAVLKDKRRVLLKHDSDYRDMIKKVTMSDPQNLFPLLTPVNPVTSKPDFQSKSTAPAKLSTDENSTRTGDRPSSGSEEGDANSAWDEWVQTQEFKPVDWKEVAQRIVQGVNVTDYSFPENWPEDWGA